MTGGNGMKAKISDVVEPVRDFFNDSVDSNLMPSFYCHIWNKNRRKRYAGSRLTIKPR